MTEFSIINTAYGWGENITNEKTEKKMKFMQQNSKQKISRKYFKPTRLKNFNWSKNVSWLTLYTFFDSLEKNAFDI